MSTSREYRQPPHLLAKCTLFTCCLLLPGCAFLPDWFYQQMVAHPPYPATVLLVNKKDVDHITKTAKLSFEWKSIMMGDDPLAKLYPKPKYWRLSLFPRKNPGEKAMYDSGFIEYSEPASVGPIANIPLDYLMRADLDLILEGTPEFPTKVSGLSIAVLAHEFPETDTKPTTEQNR